MTSWNALIKQKLITDVECDRLSVTRYINQKSEKKKFDSEAVFGHMGFRNSMKPCRVAKFYQNTPLYERMFGKFRLQRRAISRSNKLNGPTVSYVLL